MSVNTLSILASRSEMSVARII
ncbi:hypothetical protein SNQ23_003228 [Cronobacter dublinensis]|uniref:Uncharacterized protein n=1 Tax=Cronobacter dublinensis TaxID=413497 RepID=A0A9Q4T700_9ENTR|nr:hypothetical protein [Cronobacter dublinensis]ELY6226820.1 hypothetical protein [Cronobacter muytjensii]EKF2294676.1 hypothetical protein [Cronobacter dublinensis]EKF2298940.1 hypothetical protein [Cronobacter dublinensis]EKK5270814.1 hypothetical protein [Cronobacter dublinensis]